MPTISLTATVRGAAEDVFEALTDLRGYGRWLDPSAEYTGTTEISPGPTRVGTEYVEKSRLGVRRGVVTALRAPELVTFHQPMTSLAGVIDIVVTYTLTRTGDGVHLERVVEVTLPPLLRPFAPLVMARFRKESGRTVQAVKEFVERG
jgi:uncharacterized protein YndB with AHSA1/START domain